MFYSVYKESPNSTNNKIRHFFKGVWGLSPQPTNNVVFFHKRCVNVKSFETVCCQMLGGQTSRHQWKQYLCIFRLVSAVVYSFTKHNDFIILANNRLLWLRLRPVDVFRSLSGLWKSFTSVLIWVLTDLTHRHSGIHSCILKFNIFWKESNSFAHAGCCATAEIVWVVLGFFLFCWFALVFILRSLCDAFISRRVYSGSLIFCETMLSVCLLFSDWMPRFVYLCTAGCLLCGAPWEGRTGGKKWIPLCVGAVCVFIYLVGFVDFPEPPGGWVRHVCKRRETTREEKNDKNKR